MNNDPDYPKTGVTVVVIKDGRILLGKRLGSHGSGYYGFPGGKLEWGETFEQCARRETLEEAGIEITNIRFLRLLNFRFYGKHFTDVGLIADWSSGIPTAMEPNKCEGWRWFDLESLPDPLFDGCQSCLEALKSGRNYFDD